MPVFGDQALFLRYWGAKDGCSGRMICLQHGKSKLENFFKLGEAVRGWVPVNGWGHNQEVVSFLLEYSLAWA